MKTQLIALLLLSTMASTAWAKSVSYLLPKDYEKSQRFVKISSRFERSIGENVFFYQSCSGSIEAQSCRPLVSESSISESRLERIEGRQRITGVLLMTTEVVGGGILWKNLVRFTLPGFYKLVRRQTEWTESVAIGIVALPPAAVTSTGATVVVLDKINDTFEAIDPFDRFRRSELVDAKKLRENEVVLVKYDYRALEAKLRQLFH